MTPAQMFGQEPADGFWMVIERRLVMLAFTFHTAPRTLGPCCLPYMDGDRWRVEVCAQHAKELS